MVFTSNVLVFFSAVRGFFIIGYMDVHVAFDTWLCDPESGPPIWTAFCNPVVGTCEDCETAAWGVIPVVLYPFKVDDVGAWGGTGDGAKP